MVTDAYTLFKELFNNNNKKKEHTLEFSENNNLTMIKEYLLTSVNQTLGFSSTPF